MATKKKRPTKRPTKRSATKARRPKHPRGCRCMNCRYKRSPVGKARATVRRKWRRAKKDPLGSALGLALAAVVSLVVLLVRGAVLLLWHFGKFVVAIAFWAVTKRFPGEKMDGPKVSKGADTVRDNKGRYAGSESRGHKRTAGRNARADVAAMREGRPSPYVDATDDVSYVDPDGGRRTVLVQLAPASRGGTTDEWLQDVADDD